MIRCSICGAELNDGVIYCPECGFEIKSGMVQQNNNPVMMNQGVVPSNNPWAGQVNNSAINYYAPHNNQLQEDEDYSESKVGIIIGIIVVFISLAIILFLSNSRGGSSKETTTSTEYDDYVNEISVDIESYT